MSNHTDEIAAKLYATVLYYNPTHFIIEYLRVDMKVPNERKFTIIDGRRESKEWIEEVEEKNINKRIYPKFREDDSVKY